MSYNLKETLSYINSTNKTTDTELKPGQQIPRNDPLSKEPNQSVDYDNPNNIDPRRPGNSAPYPRAQQVVDLIDRFGLPVKWEQSFVCPCMSSGGHPKTDCPICHGTGTGFRKPYYLQMAIQADDRSLYQGLAGNLDTGVSIGTPQVTENGIENGIAPRDRISIDGMDLTQNYYFDVTKERTKKGMFIPYKVKEIVAALSTNEDGTQKDLEEGLDYEFDKDKSIFTPAPQLEGRNVSLVLSCAIRMYVTNIVKETRYQQLKDTEVKRMLYQNKANKNLTEYVKKFNKDMQLGTIYIRMPKKLILRREDVFLGNLNFSGKGEDTSTNEGTYMDTKASIDKSNVFSNLDV